MRAQAEIAARGATVVVVLGALLGVSASAADVYSCVDANGRPRSSDRPIPECADREQRVIGPSGTIKRIVPPSTPVSAASAAAAASAPQRPKAAGG